MVEPKEQELKLVPGRSCGTCVVCCYLTDIDTPELKKPPGTVCEHCTGTGCGVYETRPPICRTFHCGWRYAAHLDEDWRPDRSGIFILLRWDMASAGSNFDNVWHFNVFGGELAIRQAGFVEMIVELVRRGGTAVLSASGPMGLPCEATIVNPLLADVAKRDDLSGALAILISIHRQLLDRAYGKEPGRSTSSPDIARTDAGKP